MHSVSKFVHSWGRRHLLEEERLFCSFYDLGAYSSRKGLTSCPVFHITGLTVIALFSFMFSCLSVCSIDTCREFLLCRVTVREA